MCYITRDLLAADLSLRLPRYLLSPRFSLAPPRLTLGLIFQTKGQAQIKRQKASIYGYILHFGIIFGVTLHVYHSDICPWWAHRARCCIMKAVSGLMGVRMCWMGFASGNKPHFNLLLLWDPVHLSSFPSLSSLKIHLYWPNVLIAITWLPSRVFILFSPSTASSALNNLLIHSFWADSWMDGGQLLVSCDLLISSHWGLLSKYSSQKYIKTQSGPAWCQQAGKQATGSRQIFVHWSIWLDIYYHI